MQTSCIRLFSLLVLVLFCIHGCSTKPLFVKLSPSQYPVFADDVAYKDIQQAVERSVAYLNTLPASTSYHIGELECSVADLITTHERFLHDLNGVNDVGQLGVIITNHFDVFQARGVSGCNPEKNMLVTSYYQPVFEGSLSQTKQYQYPLYKVPQDLVVQQQNKKRIVRRLVDGQLVSYWSRRDIEEGKHLAGQELVWLKSPVDAFFLHVQGSGIIELPDGTTRAVRYGGKNGLEYKSIGKYMVEQGMITLEEASLETIRAYLESHPQEQDTILHHNPSYIFFEWGSTENAVGSMGQALTPGRSVAADKEVFPLGALAFLRTRIPAANSDEVQWQPMDRFVTVQDTGSAIQGPGRVDLFWGTGAAAGRAAGMMKEQGTLYILLKKAEDGHE
ncbi:MAG: transglycosylase [Desulfobacterales bacterium]|nr:MAG: transglycosylase [Desulfobacterales bacterium]